MRPKVKRVIRDAQVLSGAKARFISLVNEGANETAFIEVKSKTGDKSMAIKQRNKAAAAKRTPVGKSHKPLTSAKKGEKGKVEKAIAKFEYSTAKFKTEKSVREHLAKSDWEGDVTVIKKGNVWIVTPDDVEEDELLRIGKVATGDEGVSAFIGIKKVAPKAAATDEDEEDDDADVETKGGDDDEEDEDAEDGDDETDDDGDDAEADESDEDEDEDGEAEVEEKAKKAKGKKKPAADADGADSEDGTDTETGKKVKKQVKLSKRALAIKTAKGRVSEKKFSFWDAYNAGSEEFKDILKKGMDDGVPPGVDELMYCLSTSVRNTLAQENLTTEEKRTSLTKSAAAFSDTVAALDALFDNLINADSVAKVVKADEVDVANAFVEKYADFLATEEAEAPKASTKSKGNKSVAKKNGEAVIDYKSLGDLINDTIKPLAEKVEKLASAHPTSKAKSVEEGGNSNEDQKAVQKKRATSDSEYIAKKTERGIFGI